MEHEQPRLAEPLREEKAWESDGVTVLTASVTLPQLPGGSAGARRFNRYYRRFCRAYLSYCSQLLLRDAAESCREAMASSAPWEVAHAELVWHASLHRGDLLSVVCETRETVFGMPPFSIRRGEVWDLGMGLPMPLEEFFPPHVRCKKALLRHARSRTPERIAAGEAFREDWRVQERRALDTRNFCLTEKGLRFFYPLGSVASAKEGIVNFTMPYDEESGPFLPPI
ncbi:MAG: DUF3298 domain-containing protein [Ruminococcaceae bacterium]|nr:DUF3298 domain-containing protein [Oscillospiraceae bacterium]